MVGSCFRTALIEKSKLPRKLGAIRALAGMKAPVSLPQYRRPLSSMLNALLAAGFVLERVLEPQPRPEFRVLEPEEYARLMRRPGFITFRAKTS